MKVLDLFSGIGGFSLGLEAAGFETIAFCEREPFCQAVLKKHWPDVPCHDDVTTLDGKQFHGTADIVCGGYPCQPFSVAGKRQAEADERHLWPEMLRIIQGVRPRWVIAENVAGHIELGFDEVAASLESEGFTVWPFIIPACAVDAPHRRDRVWIIAHSKQSGRCDSTQSDTAGERKSGTHPDNSLPLWASANDRGKREQGFIEKAFQGFGGFSWCKDVRGITDYFGRPDIPEPLIRRIGNGLSERLYALGNSVIPAIPYIIGQTINQWEEA